MKSTGIVRQLDSLGRIVIPIELRRKIGIEIRDYVEIYTENNCAILKKYETSCIYCGNTHNLLDFHGHHICDKCIKEIKAL